MLHKVLTLLIPTYTMILIAISLVLPHNHKHSTLFVWGLVLGVVGIAIFL